MLLMSFLGFIKLRPGEVRGAALFYSNYCAQKSFFTFHFWSLAVEEHFYLLWPAFLVLLGRRKTLWYGTGIVCALWVWRALETGHHWLFRSVVLLQRTDMTLDAIMAGCLLAVLLTRSNYRQLFIRAMTPQAWLTMVGLLALNLGVEWRWHEQWAQGARIVQSLLFPLIVVGTVVCPNSFIGKALEWPLLRWLGKLSYSIYLWQQPFFADNGTLTSRIYTFPVRFSLVLGCACLSYYWIEGPFMRLGYRIGDRLVPKKGTMTSGRVPGPAVGLWRTVSLRRAADGRQLQA